MFLANSIYSLTITENQPLETPNEGRLIGLIPDILKLKSKIIKKVFWPYMIPDETFNCTFSITSY